MIVAGSCYKKMPFLFLLLLAIALPVSAQTKNSLGGFIDINLYPYLSDVENDNTLTINIASKLPNRFSYFSLTNFGNQIDQGELAETETYYTEQNLRWKIQESGSLDLTLQMNFRSGQENDRHRLGVRWRLNHFGGFKPFFDAIHLSWSANLHAIQIDNESGHVWQVEHVYRWIFPRVSERIYLAGFIDHTFNQDLPDGYPGSPVVGESQLGFRLIDNLYLISEYRINQYRRQDVNNLAVGLEYILKW